MAGVIVPFVKKWYSDGLVCTPPPCLYNATVRKYLSNNTFCGPLSCVSVGKWGTKWGDRNRGPLMFLGFWLSFISMVLYAATFSSLSIRPSVVKDTCWTIAKFSPAIGNQTVEITQYISLRMFVQECEGGTCPEAQRELRWGSHDCTRDICDECEKASTGTVNAAFFGLITMLPQITTNLQRSAVAGDLRCQKWIGMLTSLLGTIGGILSINSYLRGCFSNLPSTVDGVEVTYHLGPAFWCMLVGTILKPIDVILHLLIPVPEVGYFKYEEDNPEAAALATTDTVTEQPGKDQTFLSSSARQDSAEKGEGLAMMTTMRADRNVDE